MLINWKNFVNVRFAFYNLYKSLINSLVSTCHFVSYRCYPKAQWKGPSEPSLSDPFCLSAFFRVIVVNSFLQFNLATYCAVCGVSVFGGGWAYFEVVYFVV